MKPAKSTDQDPLVVNTEYGIPIMTSHQICMQQCDFNECEILLVWSTSEYDDGMDFVPDNCACCYDLRLCAEHKESYHCQNSFSRKK